MTSEIHLLIIWSEATTALGKIIADVSKFFETIEQVDVTWSEQNFSKNLSRFYGENLPRGSLKEKHCGTGTFRVIIVKDNNPEYQVRETSKGRKLVNCKLFDAKQRYRSWTLGGHKVHATDSIVESKSQLSMLLGYDYESLLSWPFEGRLIEHKKDLVGSSGWGGLKDIFVEANKCCNYVVMRNYETLENEVDALHPDIDVLCDDRALFVRLINGVATTGKSYRVQYYVYIRAKKVFFDVRSIHDNYYDEKWSREILRSRSFRDGFFVPSPQNHFFSLLYHALLHKRELTQEYSDRLNAIFHLRNTDSVTPLIEGEWVGFLAGFMDKHDYKFVEPSDLTVYWNYRLIENVSFQNISQSRKKLDSKRELIQQMKKGLQRVLKRLGII